MKNIEDQKFLADLFKRAEAGEHTEFSWIRSLSEYEFRQRNKSAIKVVINTLEHSTNALFKAYCEDVRKGSADITKLLIRNVLLRTIEFYRRELITVIDMISEYEAYLMDGNLIDSFFGEIRPISELWDRRNSI